MNVSAFMDRICRSGVVPRADRGQGDGPLWVSQITRNSFKVEVVN